MDTSFSFLGLTVHGYGLCAALAALTMLAGVSLLARREKLPAGTASLFTVLDVLLGVAGARMVYCLFNLSTFTETYENFWLTLRFFDGGLSMTGLLLGLLAALAITAKAQKISFAQMADIVCVPAGLAVGLLRLGEQFTDLGVGKAIEPSAITDAMPWLFLQSRMGKAIEFRLNVWAYEAVAGIVIFGLTLLIYHRLKKNRGDTALFFCLIFGATQILLESMRDDGHMLVIFLRIGQVTAALLVLTAWIVLAHRWRSQYRGRVWPGWLGMIACMLGIVLLEFSLDGRLTWGHPSMLRDYLIMTALCAIMFAIPYRLLCKTAGEGK